MRTAFIQALLVALFVAPCPSLQAQQPGGLGDPCSVDRGCAPGLVCVEAHYVRINGAWERQPGACAAREEAGLARFVEEPLDLGSITVTARRIDPPTFRILSWSPPPPAPALAPLGARRVPLRLPPPPEEEEEPYSFGTCSRMLTRPYWEPPPNAHALLRNAVQGVIDANIFRHDDVIWGAKGDSSLGAAYKGAGLYPAPAHEERAFRPIVTIIEPSGSSFLPKVEVKFPTVPGYIKALSPISIRLH